MILICFYSIFYSEITYWIITAMFLWKYYIFLCNIICYFAAILNVKCPMYQLSPIFPTHIYFN